MDDSLVSQGIRNIDDARFIQKHIIPIAYEHEKWNLVIFESQRAFELTLKGIIRLNGRVTKPNHELDKLIDTLTDVTTNNRKMLSRFGSFVIMPLGGPFGIHFSSNSISLVENYYLTLPTFRASCTLTEPLEGILDVQFKKTEKGLEVYINGKSYLTCTEWYGQLDEELSFKTVAPQQRIWEINELKQIGDRFKLRRNSAAYGERQFTKIEARQAKFDLHSALHLAQTFYVIS